MNVLVLYDIHGNVDALEAVLADPRAAAPDAVLIGGDVVPGPFARATLDRLAGPRGAHWIRGNGEREVAEAVDGPEPDADDLAGVTAKLTAAELGAEASKALGELPLTLELDGVLYCHATPRARRRDGHADLDARALGRGALDRPTRRSSSPATRTSRTTASSAATRFVNAGSVGLPYEGDGAARWLWVADGVPELRQTELRPRRRRGAHARALARRALDRRGAARAGRRRSRSRRSSRAFSG